MLVPIGSVGASRDESHHAGGTDDFATMSSQVESRIRKIIGATRVSSSLFLYHLMTHPLTDCENVLFSSFNISSTSATHRLQLLPVSSTLKVAVVFEARFKEWILWETNLIDVGSRKSN